jgi:hypothetical protein|nr:MAG TPA: hypothetical protein [Caudoviricetes sp.]
MNKNIIAAAAGVAAGVAIFFTREKIKALRAAKELEEDILEPITSIEEPEAEHDEEIVVHEPVDDAIDLDKAVADAQAMMDEKNSPRPVKKVNRKVESVTDSPGWTYPDEETYYEHEDLPEKSLFWFINDDMIIDDEDLPITDYVESLIGDLCEVTKSNGNRGFCINNKEGLRFSMEIIKEPIAEYMRKLREDQDEFDADDSEEDEDE